MDRRLAEGIRRDLDRKMVLLSGPRQCGKTTLARMLFDAHDYFNCDYAEHRRALKDRAWDRAQELLVFDELHKVRGWKAWVKGVYDVEGHRPRILVTGSARLEVRRKGGDALAGRYFAYRLHPLDIKEVQGEVAPAEAFRRLLTVGGFPEPFLANDPTFYERWKRSHVDVIVREELLNLATVRDITAMEDLVELLRLKVGAPVSYASLARDIERDPKTIKRWLELLEGLQVVFAVRPYARRMARAIRKEPKYYFYDTAMVGGDPGVKLENIVACALLKEIHFQADTAGRRHRLQYLRDKEGREIDFLVLEGEDALLVEVKQSDAQPSRHFPAFARHFRRPRALQLVRDLKRERSYPEGPAVRDLLRWLTRVPLDGPA